MTNIIKQDNALPLKICPLNFKKFDAMNKKVKNLDASLLLSKIIFHHKGTKIKKNGKMWIIRSRNDLAQWFGHNVRKVDKLLRHLEEIGMLEKKTGTWFGVKKIFLCPNYTEDSPVNITILKELINHLGSAKNALVFSRIAYAFANTNIKNENKKWCCIRKQQLAEWSNLSIRTIDTIVDDLKRKGFILFKKFTWKTRIQSHFHIPLPAIKMLIKNTPKQQAVQAKTSVQNFLPQPAKSSISIRVRTKLKKTNITEARRISTAMTKEKCDINFLAINKKLAVRQLKYIKSAIERTVSKNKLSISSPKQLEAEIIFSVLCQARKKMTFTHSVSRAMKILADKNWRTPIGFKKYSEVGKQIAAQNDQDDRDWQRIKRQEVAETQRSVLNIYKPMVSSNKKELTEKALRLSKLLKQQTKNKSGKLSLDNNSISGVLKEIETLIFKGAEKKAILSYLKS